MKAFYSAIHSNHSPQQFFAFGRFLDFTPDRPDRAERILARLKRDGHQFLDAPDFGLQPIAAVHWPDYLDYLSDAWAAFNASAEEQMGTGFEAGPDVYPLIFPVRGMNHRYPSSALGRAGYHASDLWMPIGKESWSAIGASANLAVAAADAVLSGESAAYALCRPSGHHASFERGGGNCYLNNAAIAAQYLLHKGVKRLALIDIDVHHGNGTQDIFYERSDVLFLSLHCDPNDCYPYYAGYDAERGSGDGWGYNINLPLPAQSANGPYAAAMDTALRKIDAYAPDALVVSLGVDGHEADPSRALSLTFDGFSMIGKRLSSLNLPTVLIQEGGYNLDTIGDCVSAVLSGFEQQGGN